MALETIGSQTMLLIPARGGSKGIPRKNIALIGGKPLIEFSITAALDARVPGRVCLTTDDEEIRKIGLRHAVEAPFLRPKELAGDDIGAIPVIEHALRWYEEEAGFHPEYIVLLQPTCPFRTARNISEAYELILEKKSDSLISVSRVSEHPCEYVMPRPGGFTYVMKPPEKPGRQNFPEVFFINGAIYITTVEYFKKTGRLFDENAILYVMKRSESLDIDTPEDLDYANWRYAKLEKNIREQLK